MTGDEGGSGHEVEATGETVGEAKWAALRELEQCVPGFDKGSVRFVIISEGERGLLGVGQVPARVLARVEAESAESQLRAAAETAAPAEEPGSPAHRLRQFLEQVCMALGSPAVIEIAEGEDELSASLTGPGLGLVIGKRGQTIDAIQYLANAIVWRSSEARRQIVVDAAGYQKRRQVSLEQAADRAAAEAAATRKPVALESMTAVERKIVHLYLKRRDDVETESDGDEPNRCVVVRPAAAE